MKKLFISCPMRGRTEENIKKSMEQMHKIAEITFGEELEVIDSFIEDAAPNRNNEAVWYLGRSIMLMGEADYFIGVSYCTEFYRGCEIETRVAQMYGIRSMRVDMNVLMPDAVNAERAYLQNIQANALDLVNRLKLESKKYREKAQLQKMELARMNEQAIRHKAEIERLKKRLNN